MGSSGGQTWYLCLVLSNLQELGVGTSWWRELFEQNPKDGPVIGCDGRGWGKKAWKRLELKESGT